MRRIEWKVQAESDLFDILDYIGHDNPDAAVELVQKIRAKVDGLRERPTLYRAGRIRGTREMIVHRNYIVFYRASDEIVTILRVKHARQQWP
ncbi:type II toxin-antitoxin system RelE/ParE family toxin [Paraburkholderia aromaticivorans]|uniref:Type II toxin-antitoxin system mRNA interferase toxin, RelE/StbE family n=1 Tax=Paraburkholderia aromaticivorans TaxID=2026199 RepID=A0A248VZI0_9BURK|nr:type II toxin-antitoxin system RelE/ParE family toxin [Paraburkholderia aromaticivorans]ASW04449.1 type II toxin-antitoxin system mRNA interferase toxin, RelE/StbE family [Paraburkholderia aromaticivorans]